MRTDNVLKNGLWGIVYQITNILLGVVGRTVFIYFLNSEYLGISGLFSNVLNMLSLTELGFSSAIAFHLYGLLAREDHEGITGIMNFYKNVYRTVAGCIFVVGLSITPFLHLIIRESSFDISYIRFVYIIYLINTVVSYFYAYKFTIAVADQKNYILTNIDTVFKFIAIMANILVLVIFKDFIIYLISGIIINLIGNFIKARAVSKRYPYLSDNTKIKPEHKKKILSDVKNIFAGKLSTVIVTSTDNILISAMVSLSSVGLYSNYSMIIGYIQAFLTQFTSATQASIGNMIASESKEHSYDILKKLTVIVYFATSFCAVSLYVLLNPFINIWLGEKYLLSMDIVIWCVLSFYIQIVKSPVWYSLGGVGYFQKDKNISIVGAVSNLVISVVCAHFFGLSGIFMGTVFSQLIQWILKTRLFIIVYLERHVGEYISLALKLILLTIGFSVLTYVLSELVPLNNLYLKFIIKVLLCVIIPNVGNIILFRNSDAFKYILTVFMRLIGKLRKKQDGR